MTDIGEQMIMLAGAQQARLCSQGGGKLGQLFDSRACAIGSRGKQPRTPHEQVPTCVLDTAARGAAKRVAADERQTGRQISRRRDNFAFRAPSVGDDSAAGHVVWKAHQELKVLSYWSGKDDEIDVGENDRIVGRNVNCMEHHRFLEGVLGVNGHDEPGWPQLPGRKGD
jgi:hypothetical protein